MQKKKRIGAHKRLGAMAQWSCATCVQESRKKVKMQNLHRLEMCAIGKNFVIKSTHTLLRYAMQVSF